MTTTTATSPRHFRLHPSHLQLAALNLVGGGAVLASYYAGFAGYGGDAGALWGGLPEALKPFYTMSMCTAALGYFPFTALLLAVDPDRCRVAGRFGFGFFLVAYALILIPSALWMPMTFALLEGWNPVLWIAIRLVLVAVGAGSLGMLAGLLLVEPRPRGFFHALAIAGAVAFCIQTALLDATIWPAYFPTDAIAGFPGS